MMKRYRIFLFLLTSFTFSCTDGFLDEKPDKSLLVPATLADFQALMDNVDNPFNAAPGLNVPAADEFYMTDTRFAALTKMVQNIYLWQDDPYEGAAVGDWSTPYKIIFYCNVVLDGMKDLDPVANDPALWKTVRGTALFFRGTAYYLLAEQFCQPYDGEKAASLKGLPLRLSSGVNVIKGRASLEETYRQLLADLKEAEELLPEAVPASAWPSLPALYGMMARIFLSMEDYASAEAYASKYLEKHRALIDFNTLNPAATRPLPAVTTLGLNPEAVFYLPVLTYSTYHAMPTSFVDPALYRLYDANDLRKVCFFTDRGGGNYTFKGSYMGSVYLSAGPSTDEMYLIRAECLARRGEVPAAMTELNSLLSTRWKRNTFVPYTAANAEDALRQILEERRKELFARGLRWQDLRRLNKDPRFAVTLRKTIQGKTYELPPGDNRYVLPIPDDEIRGAGLEQNER